MRIEIFNNNFLYLENKYFDGFHFNINTLFEFYHITNQIFLQIISNLKYINFLFYDVLVNRIMFLHPNTIFNIPREYSKLYDVFKNVMYYSKLNKETKKYIYDYYKDLFHSKNLLKEEFNLS